MSSDWTQLPGLTREAIEAQTGPISNIDLASTGNHADFASTLHTPDGRTFVKAAKKLPEADGPEVRSLRNEANINPHVSEFAPRLVWQVEAGGWLANGFEYIHARHADYSPGSPDLSALAKMLERLQSMRCPAGVGMRLERRWAAIVDDVSPMAGEALVHGDLSPTNVLITPGGRTYVVDWAFASYGAAWVELGMLIPWLLKAGHTPREAGEWVSQFPSWAEAASAHIDLFSYVFAEKWRINSLSNPASWAAEHAVLTRQWADYRLG